MRTLPIDAEYPFDIQDLRYFQIIYCYQMPMIYFVAINAGLFMTFVTSLMSFVCAQMKILKESFQFMKEYAAIDLIFKEKNALQLLSEEYINYDDFDPKDLWEQVHVNFKHSIQHHNEIKKFSNEIQNLFGINFFIDMTCGALLIGCTCVALTSRLEFTLRTVTITMVSIVALVQLAIDCYFGNNVIDEAHTITNSLYFSNWLEAPTNIKKMIIFTMENCKKSNEFSPGLSFNLSLSTFLNILKKTYSFIALLQSYTE
ncbi:odorant receptor 94b-like [Chrysoperla carnea]|uniref:odorant receptor 94b-like n=1 Tax=Chrysoperla carnea TaxID=189513 RepID=UPI001D06F19C|nr:odorant receptor 94b-like [Chrysoperla carnea]